MRRLFILLAVLTLAAPLMFYGCSGDDGSNGATGATGQTGPPGPPGSGVVADETCVLCHASGKTEAVQTVHNLDANGNKLVPYTVTAAITGVTFTPNGDNVVTAVTFSFATANAAGTAPAINLLDNSSATQLRYVRFSLAQLTPGTNGDANEWFDSVNNSRVNGRLVDNGGGSYTYTFPDNAVTITGGYLDNLTTRAAIQISSLPAAADAPGLPAPVANPTFDLVPNGSAIVTTKDDVTTAACNGCHDPLALHGGGRRTTEFCVVCHNESLPPDGNLVRLVHLIHSANDNIVIGTRTFTEFGDVAYPQALNNCLTCHKGTDDFWKSRPTMEACATCHQISFVNPPPAGLTLHSGGALASNAGCAGCHPATGSGFGQSVTNAHAPKDGAPPTPDNPVLVPNLKNVTYAINSVTVDNTNAATIQFTIRIDNVVATLGDNVIAAPTGFTGSPSFLLAYALPQDGVSAPADYNNLGRTAGQPQSVSIVGQTITAFDNTWYTVKINNAFPAGAKMRAVALQGYFTQTNGIGTDNVARHTPSVQKAVTGDAARRTVVKSGYNATTGVPEGCLECHEVFEGHGGNRVNNAQVCVMCHNPNLTTSGRTITASPINPAIVALFGSDPLAYPEDANNFKELIHGLHAAEMRVNDFVDIRNRLNGVLLLGSEVTYPGDLSHCTKCHVGTTYQNVAATNFLLTTTKITTGNASETVADINAARASVPNATDLVNTPTSSACGYCHDTPTAVSHFSLQGGKIKTERGTATMPLPELAPASSP